MGKWEGKSRYFRSSQNCHVIWGLDYLLTGKTEEKCLLDVIDSQKREEFLIKKDDVDNFIKYSYVDPDIIINDQNHYGRRASSRQIQLLNLIYDCNSIKIFTALIEASLSKYGNISRHSKTSSGLNAALINGDLDRFIKMCCSIGCTKALEFIDLKFYLIDEKTSANPTQFHIRDTGLFGHDYTTCSLSRSTLKFALNPKKSTDSVIDYFCDIEFFNEKKQSGLFYG